MTTPFIHLAVRSSFSLLESMLTTKGLTRWLADQSMPAVAVTDRNNLYGALEMAQAFSKIGVQPIMAAAFDVIPDNRRGDPTRLSFYAQNDAGYSRLMELASYPWLESEDGTPGLLRSHVFEKTEGLICLTGGAEGEIAQHLKKGRVEEARDVAQELQAAYPGRLYVEITRHGSAIERQIEPLLLNLAYELDLPIVATHDARFMTPEDAHAHDALMCISNGEYLGQDDRTRVEPQQYLKTADEMRELFADLPEALETTVEIAKRCGVKAVPRDPILPHFGDGSHSEDEQLRIQAIAGLEARLAEAPQLYAPREKYFERLDYELGIIKSMGFPGYFLIVADFIKWSNEQGIPVGPGRGSGAGSVVAWVLTITGLDPLRFDLLFERFLNPERISMPDFDIDFCQDRRGEVIRYVRDKYGADSTASIITFGTLQAKAVLRDVGRVMQMPYMQVDRLAKLIPFNPANPPKLKDAIADEPKFDEEVDEDPRVGELLKIGLALEGLYRNAGTHAAGVVIADRPLTELVPLYRDPRADLPATQFNMKWAETAGLVKFDFLGLKTVTVIQRALQLMEKRGAKVGPEWENFDDAATYELMASGETLGVFQLEGQGMRDTLRKVKPGNIEDVIAIISLYRPGPMDNIPTFVEGKEDPSKIRYDHPDLEPVLEATYGVPVYQEQVMRMAQVMAGYSLGEADLLRRAMGKKQMEEMDRQRIRFVEGAAELKNVDAELANKIFDTMAKFAGYGFNKSHAAAYAMIGYQTGYLKCHFPAEFLAASMSLDTHLTDKLASFFQEAKRLKIPVRAPCINTSTADFDVQDGEIVYALGALKGVGGEAMKLLQATREAGGPFRSLHDFAERIDPRAVNKKAMEQLARAGAMDSLEPNRAAALEAGPILAASSARAAADRAGGQGGLFGESEPALRVVLPSPPAWNGQTKLDQEFKAMGFYFSGHPLDDILQGLDRDRITLANEIAERASDGGALELVGIVRARNEKPAKKGGKFAFLGLSDPSGEVELMVYPEVLEMHRDDLSVGDMVTITVSVRRTGDEIRLAAQTVKPLIQSKIARRVDGLTIRLAVGADVEQLSRILGGLQNAPHDGKGEIILELPLESREIVRFRLQDKFPTGLPARQALKSAPGVETVLAGVG